MTVPTLLPPLLVGLNPELLASRALVWPILFGTGVFLLVANPPWARPKLDLVARLDRLDVDGRDRLARRERRRGAGAGRSPLTVLVRPLLEDLGERLHALRARFGLGGAAELEREERDLALARPELTIGDFYGQRIFGALAGLAFFPLANALGATPLGPWPAIFWVAGAAFGFVVPAYGLQREIERRRGQMVMELPTILDLMRFCLSAGMVPEQAVQEIAHESGGLVAEQFREVLVATKSSRQPLLIELEAMAGRNGVPELTSLVRQLTAAERNGVEMLQALSVQADSLRERKRTRILAEGGKASVKMLIPVAVFIMPVLFIIILVPAGVELLHLGT